MSLLLEKSARVIHALLAVHAVKARREARRAKNKLVCKRVHLKQVEKLETEIADTMEEFFIRQVRSAARELRGLAPDTKASSGDADAQSLASQIFNPLEWNEELTNRLLPVMAQGMIEAANAQLMLMGVKIKNRKASTATEYLEEIGLDLDEVDFLVPTGLTGELTSFSLKIGTEFPNWMKREIEERLEESFRQDYWAKVNETTLGDIEQYLHKGLQEGWSIEKMANEMAKDLLQEGLYAVNRGKLIARTESGHALNGARSAAIDRLIQETETEGQIQKVWLSVLGTTTRETHANLDGVPADKNGEWLLGGVQCRWPGDVRLPVGERVNCFPGQTLVRGKFNGTQRARYEGVVTKIVTASGVVLTVTPNHPIMTPDGFVSASKINPGDQVFCYRAETDSMSSSSAREYIRGVVGASGDDVDNKPLPIQNIFQSFLSASRSSLVKVVRAKVDDFYGDGEFIQGDINIIWTDWELLPDGDFGSFKKIGNLVFTLKDTELLSESGSSSFDFSFDGISISPTADPRRRSPSFDSSRLVGNITPSGALAIGVAPDFDTHLFKVSRQNSSGVSSLLRESLKRNPRNVLVGQFSNVRYQQSLLSRSPFSDNFDTGIDEFSSHDGLIASKFDSQISQRDTGVVFVDEVLDVFNDNSFSGHVYDLQSEDGCIIACNPDSVNTDIGIITSNCQCSILSEFGLQDAYADQLIQEYQQRYDETLGDV